ncbi:MAG TPA: UDP-glucose 4-epimerase GalE [Candidatus Saccharimonadales bacterium]|nr:UDP-glucose 4-epimerase GalE [Candidatus Saccharimonadales bacterium]
MKILVTGGAGYIGSFMVKRLLDENTDVVVADSLERGHKESVDSRAQLIIGNLLDENYLNELFSKNKFDAIIHFAGYISMGESMKKPELYFENNFVSTLNLLKYATLNKVNNIIFSSTAGVYGNPITTPIPEDHPKNPENPYSESKLQVEKVLSWYQKIYNLNFVALRYFNASGASLDGLMGENHNPESHIIPNAIHAALKNEPFNLFGSDYKTQDGTCVRDYIHVLDLVEAHILALKKLKDSQGGFYYNVGTGNGYSNKDVIEMIKKVSGINLVVHAEGRRPGDADILVANVDKITNELNFSPKHSDLETIIKTAWAWHKSQSDLKHKV